MPSSRPMKICWVSVNPRRGVDGVWASGTREFYLKGFGGAGLMRRERRGRERDRVVRRSRRAGRFGRLYAVPAIRLRAIQRTVRLGDQVVRVRMPARGRGAGADGDGDTLPRRHD